MMEVPVVVEMMGNKAVGGMKGKVVVVGLRGMKLVEEMGMMVAVEEMGMMLVEEKGMRESLLRMEMWMVFHLVAVDRLVQMLMIDSPKRFESLGSFDQGS